MITLTIRLAERHVDGGTIVDVAIDSKGDPCTKLERFHADVIERSVKAGLQALVDVAIDSKGDPCTKLERFHADVIERSVKAGLQALVIKATDAGIKSGYLERSNSPG